MFFDCESLTSAPALPATTLVYGCYGGMFKLCSKINKVEVGFTDWGESNTFDWLEGVASTGDFICPDGLIKKSGTSYIPEGWSINGHLPLYLNFTANAPSSRVQLNMVGGESTGLALEYSTDECQTWAPYTITYDADTNGSIGLPITLANAGDKVYFRRSGDGVATGFSASDNSYYRFSVYGSVAADGNIMSLIDRYAATTTIPGAYCFAHLFESCTGLTTAPQLPATTLKPYCYASMFSGCTGLTAAPALPATTLEKDCYNRMFYYCTKLNEIKVGFTEWTVTVNGIEYTPTKDWMYNVSSDGVFFSHAGLDRTQRDASHIPAGWMTMNYRYVVTANSADESKGTVSGGGTYEEGTEVTLTATPAEGCVFKQWSDGTTANPYVFTATKDVTLTAQFTKSYTVQVASADESKGSVSGSGIYEEGTEVTLTATPAENYVFEKWSDGTTANPYVFTAEKDVELTAMFNKITYTITAVSNDESYGTVSGGGTYEAGEEVRLFAISAEGYIFRNWSDGSTDEPYHFTATKNVSLTAIFEKAPWDFEVKNIYYKVHGDEVGVVDAGKHLDDVAIPETVTHNGKTYRVTSIEAEAFRGNEALHSVLIPNGVKEIGDDAFCGCENLHNVILGADVEVIGDDAFTNCPVLHDMYFWRATPPEVGKVVVGYGWGIHIPMISDSQEYEKIVVDADPWPSHTIYNDINVYKVHVSPNDAVVEINGKQYGDGDIVTPFGGSLTNPCCTALQESDVTDPDIFCYDLASVSIEGGDIYVEYAERWSVVLTDGTPYGLTKEKTLPELIYSREFANTDWQALYVPFSMSYDEWKDDYDIARIHNFIEYDDDDNGEFDRTYLVVLKLTSGSTEPNTPYLIRAKKTGTSTLYLDERTLQPAETNSLECSSTVSTYTFTGTYTGVTDMYAKGYYAMSGGSLKRANSASVVLKPQRWYMVLTPKKGAPAATKAQSIQILVDGEEGVEAPSTSPKGESPATFDLMGRRMMAPAKGINIVNGKKIIK